MEMTAEQLAHRQLMDEVNKAFIETPISPENENLKRFNIKVTERGLLLDPREVCKLIDAEAKRQYQEIFNTHFKDHHISTLTNAKDEVIKWFNDEEERFSKFKDGYINNKFLILNSPVLPDITPTFADEQAPTEEELKVVSDDLAGKLLTLKNKKKGK